LNRSGFFILVLCALAVLSCNSDDEVNSGARTSETAHLYATTRLGVVKRYDINTGEVTTYSTPSSDAEGIYFSTLNDAFSLVSRSSNRLEFYHGISALGSGGTKEPAEAIFGSEDLQSPRDLAVKDEFYVVSDNTDLDNDETTPEGRLFIYIRTGTDFILRNVVTTKFRVWGIEFVGDDLYAAVDETNKLALYRNFLSANQGNRILTADKIVAIQGVVRMHGLDYDGDVMVVSDIGEAESASDGALHVINKFEEKFSSTGNGGFIGTEDQLRISGSNTLLGNPVNVVYDAAYNVIFVAEALNNSGRILAFNNATSVSGNISPDLRYSLPAVSSLYFHTE
jgi:hypothetical protein